mmetsp:Transcript_35365/g.31836  ORF Transcript_35365/g.31836 Transcript_35365/m.31836 type:complete len:84 (+) Transcript_35365:447-698(+)
MEKFGSKLGKIIRGMMLYTYYFSRPGLDLNGCLLAYYKKDAEKFQHLIKRFHAGTQYWLALRVWEARDFICGIPGFLYSILRL